MARGRRAEDPDGNAAPLPRPERMADFFDARSRGYEAHMARSVGSFDRFYRAVADPIPETDAAIRVLDIGCGTGLELDPILSKAPNAQITGIDVSAGMLEILRQAYADRAGQLALILGSYLEVPFGRSVYDYAVAVMTLHHLLPTHKRELYRRIRRALTPAGAYVEGDWVVSPADERRYRSEYDRLAAGAPAGSEPLVEGADAGSYHIDVPLSLETQKRLLLEAGFAKVDVIWQGDGNSVYVARGRPDRLPAGPDAASVERGASGPSGAGTEEEA